MGTRICSYAKTTRKENEMSFKLADFNERTQAKIRKQLEIDLHTSNAGKVAKLESDSCHAPLETKEVQRPDRARFFVRVESRRKRLLDEDNICEKYIVDLLRYSGIIANDSPDQCCIGVSQTKCRKGEPEEITIEVFTT